jgi:hypothetical protein
VALSFGALVALSPFITAISFQAAGGTVFFNLSIWRLIDADLGRIWKEAVVA